MTDNASTWLDLDGIRRRWHETQGREGSEYLLALVSEAERLLAEVQRLRGGIRGIADAMDRETPVSTLHWEDDLRALLDGR